MNEEKKPDFIDSALEDAELIIYYATKGVVLEKIDLECLEALTQATIEVKKNRASGQEDEKRTANFFKQLSLMEHILYPVTPESIRTMGLMSIISCPGVDANSDPPYTFTKLKKTFGASPGLIVFFIFSLLIGLVITPYMFNLSLNGTLIVEKLDKAVKNRVTIKSEMADQMAKAKTPADLPDRMKGCQYSRKLEINTAILQALTQQLEDWNHTSFIQKFISFVRRQLKFHRNAEPSKQPTSDGNGQNAHESKGELSPTAGGAPAGCPSLSELLSEPIARSQMLDNLSNKNDGLLTLQTLNNCVLLLLFACCGAIAHILRKVTQEIQGHSFIGLKWTTGIRILLGTFSGFFMGYLAVNNDLANLLTLDSGSGASTPVQIPLLSPISLAFIGGYSVDIFFNILNRFIYALTNDEKYLPASELAKRKVDVAKLVNAKGEPTPMPSEAENGSGKSNQ
jgi:hypothetical protein